MGGVRRSREELLCECLDAIDAMEPAERALRDQLRHLRLSARNARRHLVEGGTAEGLRDILNITAVRAATDDAMRQVEAARLRAQHAFYRLSAADGMNAADIGRAWGVSRQLVSRVLNDPHS